MISFLFCLLLFIRRSGQKTFFKNKIAVRTRTVHLGNKSFRLEQEIFDIDTQEVKSRCLSILVLYDLEQKQSIPFPDEWRQAIRDYDGIL